MSATKPKLCCISIGFIDYVLPAADGMRVVALMQGAQRAERRFDGVGHHYRYHLEPGPVESSWTGINHEHVVSPSAAPAQPRRPRSSPSRRHDDQAGSVPAAEAK